MKPNPSILLAACLTFAGCASSSMKTSNTDVTAPDGNLVVHVVEASGGA